MTTFEDGLAVFTNWQTVAVGLTIYVMTGAIRRIVETGWKGAKGNKWWYEVLLPLGPIGNGILLALLVEKFPWPAPVATSTSSRVMYALVCGLFCGWLYGRVRGFFRSGSPTATSDVVSLDSTGPAPETAPESPTTAPEATEAVAPTPAPESVEAPSEPVEAPSEAVTETSSAPAPEGIVVSSEALESALEEALRNVEEKKVTGTSKKRKRR